MSIAEVLSKSTIEGNILKLPPGQLDRNVYLEVKKSLGLIGGNWKGGKVAGFVFPQDPTPLVAKIIEGGNPNLRKEFQFFPTPPHLAAEMAKHLLNQPRKNILEPSAGQGALVDAVIEEAAFSLDVAGWDYQISMYEIMDVNRTVLSHKYGTKFGIVGLDFLQAAADAQYDGIIANPPFTKNQDIDHIYHMYKMLKDGGRLVTLSSKHWEFSKNKKEVAFKSWLREVGAQIVLIPTDTFADTKVAANLLIIDK